MTVTVRPRARAHRTFAVASLGLLTAALAVAPATGAEGCDGLASDAADYAAELACASAAAEGPQVITLTTSFAVPSGAENVYDGSQPLTLRGAHSAVAVTGPGRSDATAAFLSVGGPASEPSQGEQGDEVPSDGTTDSNLVTVTDLTLTNFSQVIINRTRTPLALERLTVDSNGTGVTSDQGMSVAGVVASAGPVSISDSQFTDNESVFGGAVSTMLALMLQDGPPLLPTVVIMESEFSGNAAGLGGAVLSLGDTTVGGSTFTDNTATIAGALGSFGETTEVTASTFTGNSAAAIDGEAADDGLEAGAIAVGGALTLRESVLTENSSEGIGGAIAYSYGPVEYEPSLRIVDSTVARNTAAAGGGAVWFEGAVAIAGSTFSDNSSADGPGAVAVAAAENEVAITNSTFWGNESGAASPAVVVEEAASVSVTHATFAGNGATDGAANLGVFSSGPTVLTASVWGTGVAVPSCMIEGDLSTAANFDFDGTCTDGWSGTGDIGDGLDPLLGALADNGGATATLLPAVSSPLIDAAGADAVTTATDQRGVVRPQGVATDIGAVELEPQGSLVSFEVGTDQGVIHGTASPALAVEDVQWIPTAELDSAPPADTSLPYGGAAFTVAVPQPGDSVTITLTAPRPFTTLLKSANDGWSALAGAQFSNGGTTVTYTLTDGGELDEDGEANGFIVDPVALAVQATFAG